MFRKFSNALKISQNIFSDLTVKFPLLHVSKGKLCFSGRIYDILNGKITIFFFFKGRPLFEDVRVRENCVDCSGRICDWFQLQLWDLLFNDENGTNLSYTGI